MRPITHISAFLLVFGLAACGTPGFSLGGGGGAGAGTGDNAGKAQPIEAMLAINQPGGIDGVDQTRLSYGRTENGSQQAPAWALHLQGGEGSGEVAYPSLTTINVTWVNMQNNSQREGALSKDQIGGVAGVVDSAAKALAAAAESNSASPLPVPVPE